MVDPDAAVVTLTPILSTTHFWGIIKGNALRLSLLAALFASSIMRLLVKVTPVLCFRNIGYPGRFSIEAAVMTAEATVAVAVLMDVALVTPSVAAPVLIAPEVDKLVVASAPTITVPPRMSPLVDRLVTPVAPSVAVVAVSVCREVLPPTVSVLMLAVRMEALVTPAEVIVAVGVVKMLALSVNTDSLVTCPLVRIRSLRVAEPAGVTNDVAVTACALVVNSVVVPLTFRVDETSATHADSADWTVTPPDVVSPPTVRVFTLVASADRVVVFVAPSTVVPASRVPEVDNEDTPVASSIVAVGVIRWLPGPVMVEPLRSVTEPALSMRSASEGSVAADGVVRMRRRVGDDEPVNAPSDSQTICATSAYVEPVRLP